MSEACRTFGVHRSTFYRWKRLVDRHGLEVFRPRGRRRPRMPNRLPAMVEERIVAFAIAHPGLGPRRVASELRREKWGGIVVSANGVWRCPLRHRPPPDQRARRGTVLLELAERERATLLAVGSHGGRRAVGIALGSVATTMLHEAPCAVLIARPPRMGEPFPSSIVLGLDGSPESEAAAGNAFELRDRFGAAVRVVAAGGGKGFDSEAIRRIVGEFAPDPRAPLDALTDASGHADLLVVGSRGLHGVRALGSVRERIAHQAGCSVLVVRPVRGAQSD